MTPAVGFAMFDFTGLAAGKIIQILQIPGDTPDPFDVAGPAGRTGIKCAMQAAVQTNIQGEIKTQIGYALAGCIRNQIG